MDVFLPVLLIITSFSVVAWELCTLGKFVNNEFETKKELYIALIPFYTAIKEFANILSERFRELK